MAVISFVAVSGGLGSGKVDASALDEAMARRPDFIASDAGTTDSGPFSLGTGQPNYPRESVKRDLGLGLRAARKAGVPMLVGSAGTAGLNAQVDWMTEIASEIAREAGFPLRIARIHAEQSADYLVPLWETGRLEPLEAAPAIDAATLRASRVVGMMGVEPLQQALAAGADLVIAGRCSDAALYAALPIARGFPEGLSWHAGKVVECGTLVCETAGPGVVLGEIGADSFIVRPFGKGLRCTAQSVAAHTLYETSDPYIHYESSGHMDLTDARFEAVDDRAVRVSGSRFIRSGRSTVKLEGAELVGYQAFIVGGVRDPVILRQLDDWLAHVRRRTEASVEAVLPGSRYRLNIHVYGASAVMGRLEPNPGVTGHEVGIVLSATAETQALATKIAQLSRQPLLHTPVPEWHGAITGFACLHNPAVVERGPVYRFSLNHVAVPDSLDDMFTMTMVECRA